MKIAKRFRWEGAHRLPWHEGRCRDLHGHSYTMFVELEGEPDENGLLVDFKHVKNALAPLVDAWDHSTLVAAGDAKLLGIMQDAGWRHAVLPYDTTAENICIFVADHLIETSIDMLRARRIHAVRVRVQETETCWAEAERRVTSAPLES
ncbi:MAG: 6-carboxytetrahydropterin synthase [Rhodothermales bacterium]